MQNGSEAKIGFGLTFVFGLGGGAAVLWPNQRWIGLVVMLFSMAGLLALILYHFSSRRRSGKKPLTGWNQREWGYVSTRDAFIRINEATKAADLAYPDAEVAQNEEALKAEYIWNLVRNLAVAGEIKLYHLKTTGLSQWHYVVIPTEKLRGLRLDVVGMVYMFRDTNNVSYSVDKIDPADLEKAIAQIKSELRIAIR